MNIAREIENITKNMSALTKEWFLMQIYTYTEDHLIEKFIKEYREKPMPDATSKKTNNEWVYYYNNETYIGRIPLHRVYGAAEWKAMQKSIKSGAEYAGIPPEYVSDLDYWEFKWGLLEKKITKEQYEALADRYNETYPVFLKAELAQWNYPEDGPGREAFEPPKWG
jgi:hypothetical protein